MRVLVAAFACRPGAGSEPGAGWAMARGAVVAGHEVTLVTARHNKSRIDSAIEAEPELLAPLHPVYLGMPDALHREWCRLGRPGRHLHYVAWQVLLWRRVSRLHGTVRFDVAHHATLASDWMPAGLAWVPALPLVWGPVGGVERVPVRCRRWLGWRGRAGDLARRFAVDPWRRTFGGATARRAALVVAQNPEAAGHLAELGPPVVVRPNVFLDDPVASAADPPVSIPGRGRRRAVYAGRLLGWKGVRLALTVLHHPDLEHWELHLYGEGPEHRWLSREIERLGLGDRVHLHGQRPREDVRSAMAAADALLYPSFRDAASWVVGEALMMGCPVVCLRTGGPAVLLESGGGTAVVPDGPIVDKLAAALLASEGAERAPVRWSADDLPSLLTEWYGTATGAAPRSGAMARKVG